MSDLTRQQLCAELGISESTVMRLEKHGLPCTPVGVRAKRYNLAECKEWLRNNPCPSGKTRMADSTSGRWSGVSEYTGFSRQMRLRVTPSESKLS
jgi:predicted DNA-binding transcriptional regulator AlpA